MSPAVPERFAGLDLLAASVLLVDQWGAIRYANPSAETLLDVSLKAMSRLRLSALFSNGHELEMLAQQSLEHQYADLRQDLALARPGRELLHVHLMMSVVGTEEVLIEMREYEQQLKLDREERIFDQSQRSEERRVGKECV